MFGVGKRSAKEGIALGSSVFNVRPGSRTVCLSMGRCLTGRHRNARGTGRHSRLSNSAGGLKHRGNNNNTHHNSVGSPILMNNTHIFKPHPHGCNFGLGGGLGRLTHGSTFTCGTLGGRVIIISSVGFRSPGAGLFIRVASGLRVGKGGALMVLPRTGGFMCLSTQGLRGTGIVAISSLGACAVLGYGTLILARTALRKVGRRFGLWKMWVYRLSWGRLSLEE